MNNILHLFISWKCFAASQLHRTMRSSGEPAPDSRQRARRGVAVLLVLGMLAMTLALSYASLRGQATVAQLAENLGRGESARLAAESGIYAALRKMSEGTWAGIDTPITSNVTDNSWYEVSFKTGDVLLVPADPMYGEYAYRVTITSVGYSNDPGQPSVRSIHQIDAVVQLARRTILAEPASWAGLEQYAVHQWANRNIYAQFPVQIKGKANLLGILNLSTEYPLSSTPLQRYLADLKKLKDDGQPDNRPFTDPVTIAYSRQVGGNLSLLQNELALTTNDTTASNVAPVAHPVSVASYKLYPGGKSYLPPVLQTTYGSSLQDLTLVPDPVNNPLGIYRSRNSLAINNNVQIKGTIISEGTTPDIQVYGTNVSLQGVNLAPIEGSNQNYQLPVAIIKDDLRFHGTSNAVVQGLAMVYDEFELRQGPKTEQFQFNGQLMTAGMTLHGRDEFSLLAVAEWELQHTLFLVQALLPGGTKYYPQWMQDKDSLPYAPLMKIARDSSGVKYHWHNWTQPVYQKDPADSGLRWNLVRWVEGS